MKKKIFQNDILIYLLLLFISFFSVYYLPSLLSKIIFLIFLGLAWISKKDYIWYTLAFIFFCTPAGLFTQGASDATYRLPLYNFAPGLSFNVTDLFVILFFTKSLVKKSVKIPIYFRKVTFIFISIFIIAFIFTFLFDGSIDKFAFELRKYFTYTAFISFIVLIRNAENIHKIFVLSLITFPIIIFDQMLGYSDQSLLSILGKQLEIPHVMINNTDIKRFIFLGALNIFWLYIFSLLYQNSIGKKSIYNIIIIAFTLLSYIISATRSWIFLSILLLFLSFILGERKNKNILSFAFIAILFLLLIKYIIPDNTQLTAAWERFLPSMKGLASGNIEGIDTAKLRLIAIKSIQTYMKESPIFGFGFSQMSYVNNDLGFWNTIIAFGYFGLSAFIVMFIMIYYKLVKVLKTIGSKSSYFYPIRILTIGFTGILILYATTWDFFNTSADRIFFFCMFFGSINIYIHEALTEHYNRINKKTN